MATSAVSAFQKAGAGKLAGKLLTRAKSAGNLMKSKPKVLPNAAANTPLQAADPPTTKVAESDKAVPGSDVTDVQAPDLPTRKPAESEQPSTSLDPPAAAPEEAKEDLETIDASAPAPAPAPAPVVATEM